MMIFTKQTIRAMNLAARFHSEQTDKSGAPVLLHVFRVAEKMNTEEETICALLHDIIEDTSATFKDILEFSPQIITAVSLITRRQRSETYKEYIDSLAGNSIARRVKIADIEEHLSSDRIGFLNESMICRYAKALIYLKSVEGNKMLCETGQENPQLNKEE